MAYETESNFDLGSPDAPKELSLLSLPSSASTAVSAPVVAPLPVGLVALQRMAGIVRAELARRGLRGYRIFHGDALDLHDVDQHLARLGEERARWRKLPRLVRDGEAPETLWKDQTRTVLQATGTLWLRKHRVLLARCAWTGGPYQSNVTLWLCAAPSIEHYQRLHAQVLSLRREGAESTWQILQGFNEETPDRLPRPKLAASELFLGDEVRARLESEVIGFFHDSVKQLYASLNVPHRRGVLLHGPPGNGKTSIIRWIGGELSHLPAMILRPPSEFDDDNLKYAVENWASQAPAVLVFEDLDWMMKKLNVSTFLNILDGIDASATSARGGLLLIATTNNPDQLDPAINNRPGRFDVVMEISAPDEDLRRRFLRQKLPPDDVGEELLDQLVRRTDDLSFAHLQEILRLSGMLAIQESRPRRTDEDLLKAADLVVDGHYAAVRGYPSKPQMPFGLAQLHKSRPAKT